jgi:hypothetical protein
VTTRRAKSENKNPKAIKGSRVSKAKGSSNKVRDSKVSKDKKGNRDSRVRVSKVRVNKDKGSSKDKERNKGPAARKCRFPAVVKDRNKVARADHTILEADRTSARPRRSTRKR